MSNDLDTPAPRDDETEDYPWQYGAEIRQAYWEQVGTTSTVAFFGPTNGPASPWPGKAENYTPVWLEDSTVITTDGMSSPWSDAGDPGEGLEYYIDSPRLRGAALEELQASWELELLIRVASTFAGQGYRATFDHYGCLTLRVPEVDVPADWLDEDGNFCLLLGAPAVLRSDYIEMYSDPQAVRLIALTPLRPDEIAWVMSNGDRTAAGRALADTEYRNQVRLDRPSLLGDIQAAAAPAAEPAAGPSAEPVAEPAVEPAVESAAEPGAEPGVESAAEPAAEPGVESAAEPAAEPVAGPAAEPAAGPSAEPTQVPASASRPASAPSPAEVPAEPGLDAAPVEPGPVEPGPVEPGPVEPGPVEPGAEPLPVPGAEPAPEAPAPGDPEPGLPPAAPGAEPVPSSVAPGPPPTPADGTPSAARPDELPWDLAWVESRIAEHLLDDPSLAPLGVGSPVTDEHLTRFAGVLPDSVLHVWRRFGFDGFGLGRTWITDPLRWAPVVEAWLDDIDLPVPEQRWWCLTRTALGGMALWGEVSGPVLELDPLSAVLRVHAPAAQHMGSRVMRERMGALLLVDPMEDFYEDEDSGRDLVDVAVELLGPVSADQVYGLTPPGVPLSRVEARALSVQDAIAHLTALARAVERRLETDGRQLAGSPEHAAPQDPTPRRDRDI